MNAVSHKSNPGRQTSPIIKGQSTSHVHLSIDDWVSVPDVDGFKGCKFMLFETSSYDAGVFDQHAASELPTMVLSDVFLGSAILKVHGDPS